MVTYFDTCFTFQHSNLILVAVSYSLTISLQFFFHPVSTMLVHSIKNMIILHREEYYQHATGMVVVEN